MAATDAFTLSARVPNKVADEFKTLAESLGMTPNAMIRDMVERAVSGKPAASGAGFTTEQAEAAHAEVESTQLHVPRMYGVALSLVDDLMDAGYPESEIEKSFTDIRRELL